MRNHLSKIRRSVVRFCIGIVVLSFISGCVFRRLAFSNAETVLRYQIGSTVNLTPQQKVFLEQEVPSFLTDLRGNEIKLLQQLISDISSQLHKPISKDEIDGFFVRWDVLLKEAILRASAPVGRFQATLSAAQVEQWKRRQEKRSKKRMESYQKGEKHFKEARLKALRDQFSKWIGQLKASQMAALDQYIQGEYLRADRETQAILRSQSIVRKAILDSAGAIRLQDIFLLQQTFPHRGLDPDHAAIRIEKREALKKMLTDVGSSLSEEQRLRFKAEINSFSEDLSLIGKKH